nr:acyltransferase family protein [Streptomyces beijiangensis]
MIPQTRHEAAVAATPSSRPSAPRRDPFFDNAKYLAIVLVAIGHSWEPLPGGGRVVESLYTLVYAFHMPVFIIIAGYFSRSFDLRRERVWRLFATLVVPYAVFEVAYTLFQRAFKDPSFPLTPADPYWLLWFLPALLLWRLTTPFWQTVRWPVPLSLAVAALATATVGIGGDLQLQRVLQFLPFFVLGLHLRPAHFALVRRWSVRIVAVPVCALALGVSYWAAPRMTASWFFHNSSAQDLGFRAWTGPVMTLALFGCALVLSACFLSWVPGRRLWISGLGAGTIYGYLLHGFVIRGAKYAGWYDRSVLTTPLGEIAVTLAAATVVTLLCTPPVRRVFRCVVEPRMRWAARRQDAGAVSA